MLERTAGRKERAIRSLPDGSTVAELVSPHLIGAPCLDDAQLGALHSLALRCQESFEGPSDLEWALAGGTMHLLQRRRITRLSA